MLGFHAKPRRDLQRDDSMNQDVAKVFFDTFSRRVAEVEASLKLISSEIGSMKVSVDRGQISDLVLLDRLKRAEEFARESIVSIRDSIDRLVALVRPEEGKAEPAQNTVRPSFESSMSSVSATVSNPRIPLQVGEIRSLSSITTETELQVLTLLATEGPKSAPEIGKVVVRSREHTARLMKKLFDGGYVRRDQTRIPFRYSVVEKVKQAFEKAPVKNAERESISVPQT
jgi:DNA-binding MarR family transcriptional regulator